MTQELGVSLFEFPSHTNDHNNINAMVIIMITIINK